MNLVKRSITSASWNYSVNFIQFGITFVRQVILARLLDIEVFGIYAFISSIVFLTIMFPNFGMGSALLNRVPETEDLDQSASVHFTLKTIFTSIWVIILISWGKIFFEDQYLLPLIVIVLARGANELIQTPRILLFRSVNTRRIAVIRLITTIGSFGITIFLAMQGAGIWTLLSIDILITLIMFIGLYIWNPVWKPRFSWTKDIVRYMLDFGWKNFFAGLLSRGLDRVDDIWTGFFLGELPLGLYSKAFSFATMPKNLLGKPLTDIIRGSYAELKGDRKRLSKSFFIFNSVLIRSGFFVGGVLYLVAPEFISVVLGEKWMPMLTAFQLMLVFTLIDPVKLSIGNIFISVGKPEIIGKARLIQLIVMIIGLFALGTSYGIAGVAIAVDIMVIVGLAQQLWLVKKFVDYSLKDLFLTPLISLGGGIGLYLLISNWIIPGSDIANGFLKIGVFSLGYLVLFLSLEYQLIRNVYLPLVRSGFKK